MKSQPRSGIAILILLASWLGLTQPMTGAEVGRYPVGEAGLTMVVTTAPLPTAEPKSPARSLKSRSLTSLIVQFSKQDGSPATSVTAVGFDALMPEHNHGMNVSPHISRLEAAGAFRIDGVKLHMPGLWQLVFKVKIGTNEEIVRVPFSV